MTVILGIDPGSHITGYGVISSNGQRHQYLASGCINTKGDDLAQRLQQIHAGVMQIINQHHPDEAAIEQVFMHQNPNSALKLGQARGAAIVAVAGFHIPLAEYSPRSIKQSVVGYGAAAKHQVQEMVKRLLSLSGTPQVDAADGLAVAICHAHCRTCVTMKQKQVSTL